MNVSELLPLRIGAEPILYSGGCFGLYIVVLLLLPFGIEAARIV